eukprot:scaffold801_cov381-Pavlova_lutheri.AAC.5
MELRCNINCGGGERKHNNVPQRSAQRSRAPRRHERTSERARTHADATTLVVLAPQEKEVGAQAPHYPPGRCGVLNERKMIRTVVGLSPHEGVSRHHPLVTAVGKKKPFRLLAPFGKAFVW